MPTYRYAAFTRSGKRVDGTIEEESPITASRVLLGQGLTVSDLREAKGGATQSLFSHKKKIKAKDVAMFTRQLSVMLHSGLDLAEALLVMRDVTANPSMAEVLREVHKDISTGISLTDALSKHKAFPTFLVEMVRAGETAGNLESVLGRVAVQMNKTMRLRGQIKKALTYPTVTLSFSLIAIIVMMAVVVPGFVEILESMDAGMPALTRVVVGISDVVRSNILVILLVAAGVWWGVTAWRKTEAGAAAFDRFLLNLPIVGPLIQKSALANFSSSLAFSLGAGLNILDAMDVTIRVVGLRPVEEALKTARNRVRDGVEFSSSLAEHPDLFPRLLTGMTKVGEVSGEIESALESVAEFYESEVEDLAGSLSSMIEPFIMVFLGGFVGGIVLALMLPMVNVMKALN